VASQSKKVLWFSKAKAAFGCEQAYHWRYHLWIEPQEKPASVSRGAYVHKVLEHAAKSKIAGTDARESLGTALVAFEKEMNTLPEEDIAMASEMIHNTWELLKEENIIAAEKVVAVDVPKTGWTWETKVDSIIKVDSPLKGYYLGELKTTRTYSATLQKLYHRGIQPWCSLWTLRQAGFTPLHGIYMFIATKPTVRVEKPSCIKEVVPIIEDRMKIAEEFIYDAIAKVLYLDDLTPQQFYKDRTQCVTYLGECPYTTLCAPNVQEGTEYFNNVVDNLFQIVDPHEHLEGTNDQ